MSNAGPLRVLIVDDEPIARQFLRELLEDEQVEVAGECRNGDEAARWLEEDRVDLMFLDVRMPRTDGFELLRSLTPARRPPVVFVTAFGEHALQAFDVEALDYLLKPFDRDRLRQTLDRARRRLAGEDTAKLSSRLEALARDMQADDDFLERIAVREGRETVLVPLDEVACIEAESNYVRLHVGRRSHLVRMSLSTLEQRLDPRRFARIHRRTLVHVDRIVKLTATGRGDARVTLSDGRELTLSRRYRDQLQRVLKVFPGDPT